MRSCGILSFLSPGNTQRMFSAHTLCQPLETGSDLLFFSDKVRDPMARVKPLAPDRLFGDRCACVSVRLGHRCKNFPYIIELATRVGNPLVS